MPPDYKIVITKNDNKYVGYFLSDGRFITTFGWTLDPEEIKTIKDW